MRNNKTVINFFNELIYYGGFEKHKIPKRDNISDLLRSEDKCNQYIKEFFKIEDEYFPEFSRARHTVLSFFLGLLFAIHTELDKKIENYYQPLLLKFNKDLNFAYLWFLTVFLHDLAYDLEKKVASDFQITNHEVFQKETYVYHYSLYKYFKNNYRYDINTYKRYKEYVSIYKRDDHGIIGGSIVFQELKNELIKAYIKAKEIKATTLENFNYNNLFFSINQIDLFREIAFFIMDHNIWQINDYQIARQFALFNLISENFEKINIKKEPLLFLLSFIDILEPLNSIEVNKFSIEHILYALTNAFVEVDNSSLVIYIFKLDYLKCIDMWKEKVKSIENILDVKVGEEYNNKIIMNW